jgi:hypothetical protein
MERDPPHVEPPLLENHCHMPAISRVFYNFCRKHKSLGGKTPAMAAGLTEYVWSASDLLALDMWAIAAQEARESLSVFGG